MSKTNYGLPDARDPETGDLQAVEHEYDWNNETVTIKLVPPTLSQMQQYEELGDDIDIERLEDIVDTHIEEPSRSANEMTLREVTCYIEGVVDYGAGDGGGNLSPEVREELEQRAAAGNS